MRMFPLKMIPFSVIIALSYGLVKTILKSNVWTRISSNMEKENLSFQNKNDYMSKGP